MILEQNDNIVPYVVILILCIIAIITLDKFKKDVIISPADTIKVVDPNGY